MVTFVHIAPERDAALIRRNGLKLQRFGRDMVPARGVFAMPVGQDFFVTHQWLRELRRWRPGALCGVYFRISDDETVHVGHYREQQDAMTAAQAAALFHGDVDLGYEVVIPRRVLASEIVRIKALPQVVGWRYYPAAKGNRPLWPFKGAPFAGRIRSRMARDNWM